MKRERLAIYALTQRGAENAARLVQAWPEAALFLPQRLCAGVERAQGFDSLVQALKRNFHDFSGHVVFAASGIVVRLIAPLLRGKDRDPAVVVLDQEGRFAISLLSGHLGGANRLALKAARVLGGQPVITTATDAAGEPSLDLIAQDLGYALENLSALARISRTLLEGGRVRVWDPGGWLPPKLSGLGDKFLPLEIKPAKELYLEPLVWVGWEAMPQGCDWLGLRPPCLAVGMGCNRGTSEDELNGLFQGSFKGNRLSPLALACLASAGAKSDEPGLLALAQSLGTEILFFEPSELDQIEVPRPSDTVRRHMGTKSVCEAAAILASKGGDLIVAKNKSQNATLAVALRKGPASST